ncbi:putative E3 ubiquitin-protein ligase LIN [Musa acuminata AAA Group]|uniref:putative E3 ubiquitin-protein ligase LIN n=1 Tax=Musa acuminata AAA Group TaxID=214697 RepID=UPI0031CFA20A
MAPLKELLAQDSFWTRRTKTRPAAVTRAKSMPPNPGERKGKARSHEVAYEKSNTVTPQEEAVCFEVDMQPAICDTSTQAVVSILTGYVEAFLKHESFRASLRRRCNACLGIASELGVFAELEEAIAMIERVVEERRGVKKLPKVSLKLSVISGFTAGFPSSRLSACAHLYLSVICKIRKEDRMTADHLLQVFCTAPLEARTILLPDLWNQLFLPHLSHLKAWHKKEVESIAQTPCGAKKMKLLDKMYDDVMNRGTHIFAVYYKEWLIEAKKAPSLPSIDAPSASSSRMIQRVSHAIHRDDVYSPMVSQKSYEAVLGQLKRMEAANELRIKGSDREEERKKEIEVDQSVLGEYKGSKMINPYSGKRDHLGGESQQSQRLNAYSNAKTNEHTFGELAQAIFEMNAVDCSSACNNCQDNNVSLSKVQITEPDLKKTAHLCRKSDQKSPVQSISAEPFDDCEDIGFCCIFSNDSKDYVCPLKGQLFKEPVTIETEHIFESVAMKECLNQAKACPVTGQQLSCQSVPDTNSVLNQLVDGWVSENCWNLLIIMAQLTKNETEGDKKSKDDLALEIVDRLLAGCGKEEQMENARNLIALGGLRFLIHRFETGSFNVKTRVIGFLLCCINAKGWCRNYLADNLKRSSVLELLHSKQISARTNAVLLLIELICLSRRRDITSFLSGLLKETIANTMHALLVHLYSLPAQEKALVAVLLLHFDLVLGTSKRSIYKKEAVDGITLSLNCCLSDKRAIPNSQRALLMLGGHFSKSGEILIDSWLLQQGGFIDGLFNTINYDDNKDDEDLLEDEAKQKEKWLKDVTLVLIGNGRKSFMETLSRCLVSGIQGLVRTCLVTAAWMSHALVLLSASHQIPLAVFSDFIPQLKQRLEEDDQIEHRILASVSLLNLSKVSGEQN